MHNAWNILIQLKSFLYFFLVELEGLESRREAGILKVGLSPDFYRTTPEAHQCVLCPSVLRIYKKVPFFYTFKAYLELDFSHDGITISSRWRTGR